MGKQPWDMARVASLRSLPAKRKMHGAVGTPRDSFDIGTRADSREFIDCGQDALGFTEYSAATCDGCGYHVCACDPLDAVAREMAKPYDGAKVFTDIDTSPPCSGCAYEKSNPGPLYCHTFDCKNERHEATAEKVYGPKRVECGNRWCRYRINSMLHRSIECSDQQ